MTRNKKLLKGLKNIIVGFLFLVLFLEVAVVLANNLYFEKTSLKEAQKREMASSSANAIKHAYAAGLLYSNFRDFYFSENIAEKLVIFLGKTNEAAELVFKPKKDSTLEIMKDLNNNLIGIEAAKWLEKNHHQEAYQSEQSLEDFNFKYHHTKRTESTHFLNLVGDLAQNKALLISRGEIILSDEERSVYEKSSNLLVAIDWYKKNKNKARDNLKEFFSKKYSCQFN